MAQLRNCLHKLLVDLKHPQGQQKPDCWILQLPIDPLKIIYEYLPVESQICLRRTCLPMYNSLEKTLHRLDYPGLLRYYPLIARDKPDYWLADRSPWIRLVQACDLEVMPNGPPVYGSLSWNTDLIHNFERGALMIKHKHIQLSIKYSQLEKKTWEQKKCLNALMKPYKTQFVPGFLKDPRRTFKQMQQTKKPGYFQWYPKVVDGRYLTHDRRVFVMERWMQRGLSYLGCFGPCSHQYADSTRYNSFLNRERYGESARSPLKGHNLSEDQPECSDKFFACLRDAFNSPGTKFDGACHLCLTEFSIHLASKKLVIRTWRDLGDLSSDRVWLEQTDETEGWYPDRNPREIRSRYETGWHSKKALRASK